MNSILQIMFRQITGLAQYHTVGGGWDVVLRSFKRTCCKKAGWWTSSTCHILKSSAASIPEATPFQGCSWPMRGNDSGIRDGPFQPKGGLLWWAICSGDLIAWINFSQGCTEVWGFSSPSLLPSRSPFTGIRLASHSENLSHQMFYSPFILCSYFPQISLFHT